MVQGLQKVTQFIQGDPTKQSQRPQGNESYVECRQRTSTTSLLAAYAIVKQLAAYHEGRFFLL